MATNPVVWTSKGIIIGVEGLVFCKLKTDTQSGTTYDDAIYSLPGIQEIVITPNATEDVFPADNITAYEIVTMLDSFDVSITVADLGAEGESFLLGRTIDENGVLLTNQNDEAPYVAMGFKSTRHGGSMDKIWLYKGKFGPSELKFRTKEKGKVNWQAPVLTATFAARISDGEMKAVVNSKDTTAATTYATFLDSVYVPSRASA